MSPYNPLTEVEENGATRGPVLVAEEVALLKGLGGGPAAFGGGGSSRWAGEEVEVAAEASLSRDAPQLGIALIDTCLK